MDLIWNLGVRHKTCHQNYCKNHLLLFFAFFYQGKMLKSKANFYLRYMHLVLQLTIDDRYNQKPWRGL